MKKIGLVLFFGILLIGFLQFSSASCLEEILGNEATQLTATVNSTSTQLEFYLDTEGISCDTLDVVELIKDFDLEIGALNLDDISITFNLSNLLNNFDFDVSYREEVDKLEFSRIYVSSADLVLYYKSLGAHILMPSTTLVNNLFNWAFTKDYLEKNYTIDGADGIMNNTSQMDEILSPYTEGMLEMFGNANLVKQGNDWTLIYDQGFNDLKTEHEDWFNTTINAIKNNESFEKNITDYMQEKFSWAKDIPYLSDGGDLIVKVMPGELKVINNTIFAGTYSIPLTFTFKDEVVPKQAYLILTENITVDEIEEDLGEGKQIADEQNVTIEKNTTTLIFDTSSTVVENIIIPPTIEANKTISLDMSALLTLSGGVNVTVPNEIVLERDTSNIDYRVTILSNTTITGATSWDGVLDLPTVTSLTTSLGEVKTVVEIGDTTVRLNFDKAVKVVLANMTSKKALWANSTGSYAIDQCDSTANSTYKGTLTSEKGECYLDNGQDLVIWTYHFTKFGAYTPTSVVTEDEDDDEDGSGYRSSSRKGTINLNSPSSTPYSPLKPIANINLNNKNKRGIGITGAVVGALTNPLFWLFINVTIILGIILILISRKRKREQERIKEKIKQELEQKELREKEEPTLDIFNEEKPAKKKKKKKSK